MKRLLAVLAIVNLPVIAFSQPTPTAPTYWQDVRPILRKHCTVCHSTKNLKEPDVSGGLALDSMESIKKGLGATPVIRPGQGDDSLLVKIVTTANVKRRMPLDAPALPAETID